MSGFMNRNENDASSKKTSIHIENYHSLCGIVKDIQKKIIEGNSSDSKVVIEVEQRLQDEHEMADEQDEKKDRFTVILRDAWYV